MLYFRRTIFIFESTQMYCVCTFILFGGDIRSFFWTLISNIVYLFTKCQFVCLIYFPKIYFTSITNRLNYMVCYILKHSAPIFYYKTIFLIRLSNRTQLWLVYPEYVAANYKIMTIISVITVPIKLISSH